MKKLFITLVVSVLVLTSCTAPQKSSTPSEKPSPVKSENKVESGLTQGKVAPEFTLKNIDGKEVKLSDYRGKTVILNFFGVWCGWCTKEMPGFMKVYNEYKSKGVELVVVDNGDDLKTVVNYLKTNKYDIKPLMDSDSKVVRQYRVQGFPTTFILDKDGIIKAAHSGYMDEGVLRDILGSIVN